MTLETKFVTTLSKSRLNLSDFFFCYFRMERASRSYSAEAELHQPKYEVTPGCMRPNPGAN